MLSRSGLHAPVSKTTSNQCHQAVGICTRQYFFASLSSHLPSVLGVGVILGCLVGTPQNAVAQLTPPPNNSLTLSLYAAGVQIYNSSEILGFPGKFEWKFLTPQANLYTDSTKSTKFGIHFGGPTWQSLEDGSLVTGKRLASSPSSHPRSIPELLLQATSHSGDGIFSQVDYIQRLDTIGGLAPIQPPTSLSDIFKSPYSATYKFYVPVPEPGVLALLTGFTLMSARLLRRRKHSL